MASSTNAIKLFEHLKAEMSAAPYVALNSHWLLGSDCLHIHSLHTYLYIQIMSCLWPDKFVQSVVFVYLFGCVRFIVSVFRVTHDDSTTIDNGDSDASVYCIQWRQPTGGCVRKSLITYLRPAARIRFVTMTRYLRSTHQMNGSRVSTDSCVRLCSRAKFI